MTFHGGGWSGQSRPRTDCGRRDQAFLTRADLAVQSRRSYAQSCTELRPKSATTTCSSRLTPVGSLACSWERARRRPGTAMSRPPERGWWLTSWCASIVVANRRTAHARSRTRSSSDCGGAMTSPCRKGAVAPALRDRARASEILSLNVETSTATTAARSYAAKVATSTSCTSRPDRRD
jgi:hypothetical protein